MPDKEGGGSRWSLDHLFIDHRAIPTLVEVKRSEDTRIRREVFGQMLDYAANGVVYWPVERLRAEFAARCSDERREPSAVLAESLGDEVDEENFWQAVEGNLRAGKIRLVLVADEIPRETRRVIEFLNEQMSPAEVIGLEIAQYEGSGEVRTLIARTVGQTEQARVHKPTGTGALDWSWSQYQSELSQDRFNAVRELFDRIQSFVEESGEPWEPHLRKGYISFWRPGGYGAAGIQIYREKPVTFWIKLPLSPEELRDRDHDVSDPYTHLESGWDAGNKQWWWEIPTIDDVPEVSLALGLTAAYQPESGPMPIPDEMPAHG